MARRRHRPLNEDLKDLFAMHRGERRAFTVLLALCLIGAAWVTWEQWLRPRTVSGEEQLEVAWWGMQDSTPNRKYLAERAFDGIHLFKFDPNGLPVEQWAELGLSEKQAGAIHRYEERGGKFRTRKDLAKMRVVDPELFARWEPFILLPDQLPEKDWKNDVGQDRWPKDSTRWEPRGYKAPGERVGAAAIELNGADSTTLVTVHGIGPSFARGIIKYRDRLGGYANLEQLGEVYVLRDKPDAVERIKGKLAVDPLLIRRINLNHCTVEDLGPHPYCGWKVAKALIAYRGQHGPFPDVAAISNCVLVTDSIRERLSPYLMVDH